MKKFVPTNGTWYDGLIRSMVKEALCINLLIALTLAGAAYH